ncbi:MAG: hypothetical protein WCA11_15130 [Terracidiphilus sp.]
MGDLKKVWPMAVILLLATGSARLAWGTDAPPDPCSLLSAAAVSKALVHNFGAPEKSVAPRPYANTVQGTDCRYEGNGGTLLFRIYFDPSPSEATSLFAKLRFFYSPPTPVNGIGDEAYFDPNHGLHVRKGNVRFFLSLGDNQKPLADLASQVAGRL